MPQELHWHDTGRQTLMLGAAVVAVGLAAGAGVLGRKPIARLVQNSLENADAATRSFGHSARRASVAIGQELELQRLLAHLGFPRRRSLLRRLAAPAGLLGGLLAATATTLLLVRSRKLSEVKSVGAESNSADCDENGVTRDFVPSGNDVHAHQ